MPQHQPTFFQADRWCRERMEAARRARLSHQAQWHEVHALQDATRSRISAVYESTGYGRRPVDNLSKLAELNISPEWPTGGVPRTATGTVGRFAWRPLERAEVVHPRPGHFSKWPVTHTK